MLSRIDYILGTDSRLFQKVAVRYARHNTYHYLVFGCLRRIASAAHYLYLGRCTCFPIRPPATPDRIDRIFAKIRQAIPRTPRQECHCQAWISPDTWSIIDTRISARLRKDQQSSWDLSHAIKAGIQEYRHRRADESGSVVESLLVSDPHLIQ